MGDNNSRFTPEQVALLRRIAETHKELVQLGLELERKIGVSMHPSCCLLEASDHNMAVEMLRIMGFNVNHSDCFRYTGPEHITAAEPYGWGAAHVYVGAHSLDYLWIKFPLREGE